jgi:hypothetical protein
MHVMRASAVLWAAQPANTLAGAQGRVQGGNGAEGRLRNQGKVATLESMSCVEREKWLMVAKHYSKYLFDLIARGALPGL